MKKALRLGIGCTLGIVMVLVVCAPSVVATNAQPGTVTIAYIGLQEQAVDPHRYTGGGLLWACYAGFNALQDPTETGIGPGLATSWKLSKDGKTWEFDLRRGVKFATGEPFTAEDFVWSYNRCLEPDKKNMYAPTFKRLWKGIEAVGDYTILVHTKDIDVRCPERIAGVWAGSKAYWEKVGDEKFTKMPIGTGPFKLVENVIGTGATYVANEHYWEQGYPKIKKLKFVIIPESATRLAALKTGEIDIADNLGGAIAEELKATPSLKVFKNKWAATCGLGFADHWEKGKKSPFHDVRVRKAFNLAIDREAIVDAIYKGEANIGIQAMCQPDIFGANPNLKPYTYNIEEAKRLLKEAGYPRGFKTEFHIYRSAWMPKMVQLGEAIAGMVSEIGITGKVSVLDAGSHLALVRNHEFRGIAHNCMTGTYTDFLGTLELFYLSTAPYSTMDLPYMDDLIKKASMELDQGKREKILQEAYTYIYDQYWNPAIVWANYIMGAGPRIKDWKPRQGACFPSRFQTIELAE